MDPDSNSDPNSEANDLPVLSYLLSQLDFSNHPTLSPQLQQSLFSRYPHLTNPKVVASIAELLPISVSQTHSHLLALGPRPDPDAVSVARSKIGQAEEVQGTSSETGIYKAILRLEELHQEYQRQLKEAEEKLDGAYRSVVRDLENDSEVNEEIISVLKEAESGVVERVELAGRQLRFLPEAFGRIRGLVVLNLSRNQLEVLPDSIAGLKQLEELDVSSNLLESLPDSIGLLLTLKVLNVSGNKLKSLPESIAGCRSLVELDASFNNLVCLPSNIGFGLPNLERLSIQLNKIPFLPPSICEMRSLRFLDVHFNELRGLPRAIGRLTNVEVLNLSSNFNNFKEIPETISDLINLRELDLSNNQIRALPDSFGRLEKLTKLNLDENPLVIPPLEIVNRGVEAVREFMIKRWHDIVAEGQQRSMVETNMQQGQTGWLAWGSSLVNDFVSGVSQSATVLLGGGKPPMDPYLDQQL